MSFPNSRSTFNWHYCLKGKGNDWQSRVGCVRVCMCIPRTHWCDKQCCLHTFGNFHWLLSLYLSTHSPTFQPSLLPYCSSSMNREVQFPPIGLVCDCQCVGWPVWLGITEVCMFLAWLIWTLVMETKGRAWLGSFYRRRNTTHWQQERFGVCVLTWLCLTQSIVTLCSNLHL